MLLLTAPYRNPPYRMPTLERGAAPSGPALLEPDGVVKATESPKRKRTPSVPGALSVDTSGSGSELGIGDDVCDSPRSKVAARLGRMDLRPDGDEAPRKRTKTRRRAIRNEDVARSQQTPIQAKTTAFRFGDELSSQHLEIAETPDCRLDAPRSPGPSPVIVIPSRMPSLNDTETPKTASPRTSPKRMRSPPPARSISPVSMPATSASQNSNSSQDSVDASALVWQDTEITGHEIDATSPDDDGEGINGVGFRPTPMIAYARSQKRKQQVNEWRAREAREARQRRFQKRQGCAADAGGTDGEGRRAVRFADVS